jgi:hypothetical protein
MTRVTKSDPASLWDIRWFRNACIAIFVVPPILGVLGTLLYAAGSGNLGILLQSGNVVSIVLIVSFLLLGSIWFLYRDYLTTRNLNPEPATLHLKWSWPKVFAMCLPLFPIGLLLVFFGTEFSRQIATSGFLAFARQPDLYMVLALAVTVLWPYYVLFVKRIPKGALVLTEEGLVIPHLGSNRPIPWNQVWPHAGFWRPMLLFDFFLFTLNLNIDPHVYPNVRRPRSAKPGDLLAVSYSFPAAFSETKWVILRRIAEFKAKDASAQTGPER